MGHSLIICHFCEVYFLGLTAFYKHCRLCEAYPACRVCLRDFCSQSELKIHIKETGHWQDKKKKSFKRVSVSNKEYNRICERGDLYTNDDMYTQEILWKEQNQEKLKCKPILSPPCSNTSKERKNTVFGKKKKQIAKFDNVKDYLSSCGKNYFNLYSCKLCHTFFLLKMSFYKHSTMCKRKTKTCLECHQIFDSKKKLKRHIGEEKHAKRLSFRIERVNAQRFEGYYNQNKIADISKYPTPQSDQLKQSNISTITKEKSSVDQSKPFSLKKETSNATKNVSETISKDEKQSINTVSYECISTKDIKEENIKDEALAHENPVSPCDSGCNMDDGLNISLDDISNDDITCEENIGVRGLIEEACDNITKCLESDIISSGVKKRKDVYKPQPKSVKIARLECNYDSLHEYLKVQQHPEKPLRCLKLQLRTESCPGCMDPIDTSSAVLHTESFNVSMWCQNCEWIIMFTNFFHT